LKAWEGWLDYIFYNALCYIMITAAFLIGGSVFENLSTIA